METPIITTRFTNLGITYTHVSETVQSVIRYLLRSFKPNEEEPVSVIEFIDLKDYGNEYAFLMIAPTNPAWDPSEEIPAYLDDMPHYCNLQESDYLVISSFDHTNNHAFIMLTFSR